MKFTPLRVALIYLVFALVWIFTTDTLLERMVDDVEMLTSYQIIKGFFYVTITALGLYWMMKNYEGFIKEEQGKKREVDKSLRLALDSANMATWEYDIEKDSYITSANFKKLLGIKNDHPLTLEQIMDRIHEDEFELFQELSMQLEESHNEFDIEFKLKSDDKKERWLWSRGVPRVIDGKIVSVSGVTADITEKKELKEKLDLEREKFRRLYEKIPVLITIYDPEINITELNREFVEVLGWEQKDAKHYDLMELCYPDPEYRKEAAAFMMNPDTGWKEFRVTAKDGEVRDQVWTNITLSDDTIVGIGHDITERKRLEKEISNEREELTAIFDSMPVFINIHDESGQGIAGVNHYFEERFGYTNETLKQKDLLSLITTKENYESAKKHMEKADGSWKDFELTGKDGEIIFSTWTNIKLSESKSLGIGLDITERKLLEQQIEDSKKRLEIATESANVGLWEWHPNTGTVIIDEIWANLVGYTKKELEPISIETWNNLVHPDDLQVFEQAVERYFSGDSEIYECEVRMKHKDGHWVWILDRGRTIETDEKGNTLRMAGTHVDITDQKLREKELSDSEQLLKASQRMARLGTYILNPVTLEVHTSDVVKEIFGLTGNKELNTKVLLEMIHPEDIRVSEKFLSSIEKGVPFEGDFRIIRKSDNDNEEVWIKEKTVIEKDARGKIVQVLGIMQDITGLKRIQKSLEYEQKRFEYAALVVSDAIWDAIPSDKTIWWSEGFKTNFGYNIPEPEEGYKIWYENLHPEDRDQVVNSLESAENSSENHWKMEYRFRRADGSYAIVIDRAFILRNEDEEIVRIIGAMNDITREKTEEEQLKRSEEQYRLLFEQSPMPMWIFDPDTFYFESANKAAIEKYGYSAEEFKKLTVFDLYKKEDQDAIRAETSANLKQERSGFDLWTHITKSGEEIFAEISGSFIYSGSERKRLVIANDVTVQRKAEEKAIRAMVEGEERERRRIANELHDGLGQYLSAANMNLTSVFEDLPELDEKLHKPFKNGLQMLAHAISETRSISQNLLPKSIQDYGLRLAVEALINDLKPIHNIEFYLYQNYDETKLPSNVQINIFRILQEAINNSLRHADSNSINVQINESDGKLICTIEDNGIGFNAKDTELFGLGIQSMKTRVAAMSGNFDIDSKPGSGTLITVILSDI